MEVKETKSNRTTVTQAQAEGKGDGNLPHQGPEGDNSGQTQRLVSKAKADSVDERARPAVAASPVDKQAAEQFFREAKEKADVSAAVAGERWATDAEREQAKVDREIADKAAAALDEAKR